ncbi:MAG: tetratricopeptide repeat protein [bacterium]
MKLIKHSNKIIEIGLIVLVLAVPLYFDTHLHSVYDLSKVVILSFLSLVMFYICLLRIALQRQIEFSYNPLFSPIIAFLLISIISTLFSYSPLLSLIGIYRRYNGLITTINYVVLFFLVVNFISQVDRLVKTIIFAGTVAAIYGIFQHFGIDPLFVSLGFGKGRVTSSFGNPVFLSAYLIMVFPLALSLYLDRKDKWLTTISLCLLYTCLLMAKTRASFLGLFVALFLFGVLDVKRILQNKVKVIILGIILIGITLIFGIGKGSMIERVIATTKMPSLGVKEERFKLWEGAMGIIRKHPLIGVGQESMSLVFQQYAPIRLVVAYKGARITADKSHNEFLDVVVEKGIIGLVIYLWLLITFIIMACKIIKDKQSKSIAIGILSAWTGYLTQALFNLSMISITHLFFILMGMMVVLYKCKMQNVKCKINKLNKIIIGFSTILVLFLLTFIIRAYLADVNFQQAIGLKRGGFSKESIPKYEQAIKLNPIEKEYRFELILTYLDLDKSYAKKALILAKETSSLAPEDSNSWYLLARTLEHNEKDIPEIINAYQKARELSPCWADVHNNLGILYAKSKELNQAKKEFELAAKFNPTSTIFLDNLVTVCLEMKNIEECKKILKRIIKLAPQGDKLIDTHNRLAWIYYNQGDFKKAISHYQAIIDLSPINIDAHRNLGSIYYKLGKKINAQKEFKEVLTFDPNNTYALKMLSAIR